MELSLNGLLDFRVGLEIYGRAGERNQYKSYCRCSTTPTTDSRCLIKDY